MISTHLRMEIHKIYQDNKVFLEDFLREKIPPQFRYFEKRSIDVIANHKLTVVGTIETGARSISYGHIDYDLTNNTNWVGVCVLEEYQGHGYGKQMFQYLMDHIQKHNIENVKLTVDVDNWRALNMYLRSGFKIIDTDTTHRQYYTMKLIKSPLLEVSLGEAMDKLTILDIKKQKIKDDRLQFVEKEYNMLFNELEHYIVEHKYYYTILLSINKIIWEMQDEFRYSNNNDYKNELCLKIIDENDRRFRVKRKINNLCHSELKEQKGYNPKKAFVLTHLGLGDNITSIGAVRYLSTQYDEVYVVCKTKYRHNVEMFYRDDPDIKVVPFDNDEYISPNFGCSKARFLEITQGMDTYLCGYHLFDKPMAPTDMLPFNFYKDLNINPQYFWTYYHLNNQCAESKELYSMVKDYEIVFVHNQASTGLIFDDKEILAKLNIGPTDTNNTNTSKRIVINPDKNIYNRETDPELHRIAEQFVYKPLLHYMDIIIHSKYLVLADSCFFCLSLNLPIQTDHCYYISRDRDYQYFYNANVGFDPSSGKKVFTRLL